MPKKLSKFQIIGAILIVALCVFLVLCFVQKGQIGDLEVENSGLEKQIETIQTEHDETRAALKKAEGQVDAKQVEIEKLESAAQKAEEAFSTLQVDHDQLEKKVGSLQSLRRGDRYKISRLTEENKELKSALSVRKAAAARSLNAIKKARQSVNKSTQATEKMLDAVAQSRARIAEINQIIDEIEK